MKSGMGVMIGAVFAGVALCHPAGAEPRFDDLTGTLPAPQVYSGGWEHFVGGGVAVLDCDADGYPDLYAAGGERPARLYRNTTPAPGAQTAFLRADAPEVALTGVTGAYPLDIDGDGILDLFVMRAGPNVALRGLGNCRFEDATEAWGIDPGKAWTTAFSATWEPGQDWPTLAVGNYVDRDNPDGPFEACDKHQLFRPHGRGYGPPETISPGFCTLSMLFFDWSGDGHHDLWISNDRHYYVKGGREQLYRITPTLKEYGPEDGWQTHKLWGMGIATRDLDGDARPEVAVTSMADQYLFQLDGDGPDYTQTAFQRGTTAQRPYVGDEGRPSTGWHAQFGDVDNDGRDDLFIAKGNVEQMPGLAMKDPDNLLMQSADGHFTEKGDVAGIGSTDKGRGAALTDLNRDGRLDLVVMQRGAPMKLYQNVTDGTGHWLEIRLRQSGGNADAVGARIELEAGGQRHTRDIEVGGGHAGGQAGFEHFGLGTADAARIRVRWPDGTETPWTDVAPDRFVVLSRDADGMTIAEDSPAR